MDSLDLGVLSVVASFGRTAALARLAVAIGRDRGAELMSSAATVDALVMRRRHAVELRLRFRAKNSPQRNSPQRPRTSRQKCCPAEGLNLRDRAVAGDIAAKRDMSEDDYYFLCGGVKESVCFPFEYDGPAFAGRCECCCPPSLTSPVFRKIDVTPKPDDVHPSSWYRDY